MLHVLAGYSMPHWKYTPRPDWLARSTPAAAAIRILLLLTDVVGIEVCGQPPGILLY